MSQPPYPPDDPRNANNPNSIRSVATAAISAGVSAVVLGTYVLNNLHNPAAQTQYQQDQQYQQSRNPQLPPPPATYHHQAPFVADSLGRHTPRTSPAPSHSTLAPSDGQRHFLVENQEQVPFIRPQDSQVNLSDELHGPVSGYRSVAYFVNWAIYARKHRPQDLPVENLTHILYAFANVRPETGEVYLTDSWADTDIHWEGDSWNDPGLNMYGCLKQLNLLKRRHRNLKVLLSIGGWTYSPNFRLPARTPDGRTRFAMTAVQLVKDMGFDGLDIDWEYPQNALEAADLVDLLRVTRLELDAYASSLPKNLETSMESAQAGDHSRHGHGRPHHLELTVACPAGSQNYMRMDLQGMDRYLDFWNLMAYDFTGSWDSLAGHQSNIFPSQSTPSSTPFSTDSAVSAYLAAGIHPSKLVLGMPLYGRAFENTDGPGYPYNGIGEGTWEHGVYDFNKLPLPGSREIEDRDLGASWCLHEGKVMVTYDTRNVAIWKAEYMKHRHLGGGMWWESSGDREGGESLIATVVKTLGGRSCLERRVNCITYPDSKYDNVRNGFLDD